MSSAIVASETVSTLAPAGIKAVGYKIVDLCGELYAIFKTNYGDTLIFRIIEHFPPSEDVQNVIKNIISGYSAWFKFEGTYLPSPYKIGLVWLGTFRDCIGCSTREQCITCLWAAVNTIAACFPSIFPAKFMVFLVNFAARLAYDKFNVINICPREDKLIELLSQEGVYGQF